MPYSDAQKKALLEEFSRGNKSQTEFCNGEGRPSRRHFSRWVKYSEKYGVDLTTPKGQRKRAQESPERNAKASRTVAGKSTRRRHSDAEIAEMIRALYSPRDGRRSLVQPTLLPSGRDKFPDVTDSDYILQHLRHLKAGNVAMGPLAERALKYAGIPLEDRKIHRTNGETITSGKKIADSAEYAPRGGWRDEVANAAVSSYASPSGSGYAQTDPFAHCPTNVAVSPYADNSGFGHSETALFPYYPASTTVSPFAFDSTSGTSQTCPVPAGGHGGEPSAQVVDEDGLRQFYASLAAGEASDSHYAVTGKEHQKPRDSSRHSHSHSHGVKAPRR
ncbi:hypothetical protein ACJ6WF_17960 [Streptomyces sp. MMS24-I2-30]|uniref:hypothetical protein n=1 Tax=Streptomyces sp. MMS24-I2-30 TaxID=3351564 RepID=UPI003896EC4A